MLQGSARTVFVTERLPFSGTAAAAVVSSFSSGMYVAEFPIHSVQENEGKTGEVNVLIN